jgi:hypothetical protein
VRNLTGYSHYCYRGNSMRTILLALALALHMHAQALDQAYAALR